MITPPKTPYNFESLLFVVRSLLGPNGCPWDITQTHESLARYTIEEAYELVDAIENGDADNMREELGDLMFQITLHTELARKSGKFNMHDVINKVTDKMISRHPHVFSDTKVESVEHVLQNWEELKAKENKAKPLFNLPKHLPSLLTSQKIGEKTERVKFDWSTPKEVLIKVDEELNELKAALSEDNKSNIKEEIGDLIFTLVQLSRHLNIDAEQAVRETNTKFANRYQVMQDLCKKQNINFADLSTEEKENLWQQSKAQLKKL